MPQYAVQQDLFGGQTIAGNVTDKITHILEEFPGTRASYRTLLFRYWMTFDNLGEILGDRADDFKAWLENQATSTKTLQNRCMEIQNRRPDLEAPPEVAEQRKKQSKAGRVGAW